MSTSKQLNTIKSVSHEIKETVHVDNHFTTPTYNISKNKTDEDEV